MFGDGGLTFREFAMKEPLPLSRIHDAVIDFLRNRDDAVLFGAQAVNAYVDEPRMTQDVDILSTRAAGLAEEIRAYLAKEFTIAARVREVAGGRGFRIFQLRQPKNRHLVDVRQVTEFPPTQVVAEVRVPTPEELIAQKVMSLSARSTQPKGDTDRRDLKVLLLEYPHLKTSAGAVRNRLNASGAQSEAIGQWETLVASEIQPESDADAF
ncbi:MAG TPA: nucleotidyl transferase AbiEii/AbiGii toxin family protein [Tepidisphaeraceae bacterium]|nr:nucleotidyl transferase AbiEii/AbiGii toxin family protein [Tepidisphaeraceae bacterium]